MHEQQQQGHARKKERKKEIRSEAWIKETLERQGHAPFTGLSRAKDTGWEVQQ